MLMIKLIASCLIAIATSSDASTISLSQQWIPQRVAATEVERRISDLMTSLAEEFKAIEILLETESSSPKLRNDAATDLQSSLFLSAKEVETYAQNLKASLQASNYNSTDIASAASGLISAIAPYSVLFGGVAKIIDSTDHDVSPFQDVSVLTDKLYETTNTLIALESSIDYYRDEHHILNRKCKDKLLEAQVKGNKVYYDLRSYAKTPRSSLYDSLLRDSSLLPLKFDLSKVEGAIRRESLFESQNISTSGSSDDVKRMLQNVLLKSLMATLAAVQKEGISMKGLQIDVLSKWLMEMILVQENFIKFYENNYSTLTLTDAFGASSGASSFGALLSRVSLVFAFVPSVIALTLSK